MEVIKKQDYIEGLMIQIPIAQAVEDNTVEAISKADYENRLKADMVAMLTEIQLEIAELDTPNNGNAYMDCVEIIQEKINALRGEK